MTPTEDYIMVAAFILCGGFALVLGFFKFRKYRVIRDTPRSRIGSLSNGIVEIEGSVETDKLIKSPFSKADCVFYKYEIKEYRRSSSSQSKRLSYRWETASSGDHRVPFYVVDETGKALVEPDKADFVVSHKNVYSEKNPGSNDSVMAIPKFIEKLKNWDTNDPAPLFSDELELEPMDSRTNFQRARVGGRRYHEYYIEPGDKLFVLGTATKRTDSPSDIVIKRGTDDKTFVISDKSEKAVLKSLKKMTRICFILGAIFIAAGIVMLLMIPGVIPEG